MKKMLVVLGLVSALGAVTARAEDLAIGWQQKGIATGNGVRPRVASDGQNGMTSLIYEINTGFARLEYENGWLDRTIWSLSWNGPWNIFSSGQPTNEVGENASIAMVDCGSYACFTATKNIGNVVQVHQGGQDSGAALWYRTGVFDNTKETTWADAQQYDQGYNPTVAIDEFSSSTSSTTVVEVHQGGTGSAHLWYHVGTLSFSETSVSVTWGPAHDSGLIGSAPSVSVESGIVLLAAEGTAPNLWYSLGTVDTSTNTITWGAATSYGTGYRPSISFQSCGFSSYGGCDWTVVEAHQGGTSTGSLYYRLGIMNGATPTSITWTPNSATNYASGCSPSVSQLEDAVTGTNNEVVEAHATTCGTPSDIVSSWGIIGLK